MIGVGRATPLRRLGSTPNLCVGGRAPSKPPRQAPPPHRLQYDLFCTFFTILGLDPHKELTFEGRPVPLVENKLGKPIAEVL